MSSIINNAVRGLRSFSTLSSIIRQQQQGSMQAGLKQATVPGLAGMLSNRYKFDKIPDQSNKNAIVTGGSAGIGANIAYGLALKGARGEPSRRFRMIASD